MPEEVKLDPQQAPTQDAQLAAENMLAGKEQTPKIDADADYEASKAFSVSQIDRTQEGAKAAEAVTSPELKIPEATEMKSSPDTTGNPGDYLEMAKDVGPAAQGKISSEASGESGDPANYIDMAKDVL